MRRFLVLVFLLFLAPLAAQQNLVKGGGFEQGLALPWGTGQFGGPPWWNSGGCDSAASIDASVRHRGRASLHIVNRSGFAPNVYGTTQQPLDVAPGQRYRIELWAKARDLAREATVNIIVNENWGVRPIRLRGGTYDWTRFTGDFTPPDRWAQLRILIEDRGEAWIDDVSVVPVDVPKELEEFGDLVTGLGPPLRVAAEPTGADVAIEPGTRLVVPRDAFSRRASLQVSVSDLALSSVDPRVSRARVYGISCDRSGPLARPVVLDLGVPPEEVLVAEKVGGSWRKVPLLEGHETARVAIREFSNHWLATVFRIPFVTPPAERLREDEARAAAKPWVAEERESTPRARMRRRLESSGSATRGFYGVGEKPARSQAEMRDEVRRVLASRRAGLRELPPDSPGTNEELLDYLHGITNPSTQKVYFWDKVAGSQEEIRRNVVAEPGRVTPGRLLAIAIDANGGDVRLGVLAAANFLKSTTMGGRDYPKSKRGEDGNMKNVDVPAELAEPAGKLVPWRTDPLAPAGYYDKMGPLYHLFAAMVAGVWGGTHFSRFAVVGENFLRSTGWENDYPDPEKGDADLAGANLARWINDGMPGAEKLAGLAPAPAAPESQPPPRAVVALLAGAGTWSVSASDATGEGPIAMTIDVAKGTISGELSGSVTNVWKGERTTISSTGRIEGSFSGSAEAGTFRGKVVFDPRRTSGGASLLPLEITGELRGGAVTGAAIAGVSPWDVPLAKMGDEMGDIRAQREGGASTRRRSDAEIRREVEETRRAQGRRFSFPVTPR